MADKQFNVELPAQDRRDEVVQMAATMQIFKEAVITAERLGTEQGALKRKVTHKQKEAVNKMANESESSAGSMISVQPSAAIELEATASSLTQEAETSFGQVSTVAQQAESTTAEELSVSIHEVTDQVEKSSEISLRAMTKAKRTDQIVSALAQDAQKMREVTSNFEGIAGQTNLLALNATIEAIRATPLRLFSIYGLLAVALLFSISAHAQSDGEAPEINPWALIGDPLPLTENGLGKSHYSLFNPVPDDQMRPFSPDRPGKTHSSVTVDAGHFQVESDFYNYTYDQNSPQQQTTRTYSAATPIMKVGVTNWADLEAAFAFYNETRVTNRATGATTKGNGFGDVAFGSKINLFGNDSGTQALALLPFIKIPTAANNVGNGVIEYTLNVPYTINLDTLWSVTMEPAFGLLKNINDNGLHGDYSFLVNVNRPVIFKTVTAALELASEYSSDPQVTPRYTLDPSLQWLVTPSLQVDVGIYIGLNRAAPDYNAYTGFSFRY